jgi:steroid delta-isomerase-like uncharacterized protein
MKDSKAVVEAWFKAVESKNVERLAELLADDVSFETEALSPIRGKSVLVELLSGLMDAYAEIHIRTRKMLASGRDVAALVDVRVEFGGDIRMMGETLPTRGRQMNVVGALFVEVSEEGKIARAIRVRDNLSIMRQLEIAPERMDSLERKVEERLQGRAEKPRSAA